MRDRSWLLCRGWRAALLVRSIDIRGFVIADDRAALLARSIVATFSWMAEVLLRYIHDRCSIDPHRAMPGRIVCMALPLTGPSSCLHGN